MKKIVLFCVLFLNFVFIQKVQSQEISTDVLVVGASQSGVTAAVQAARNGSKVVLVSESDWPGGSTIEAGVAAFDGNELLAFQTGLWGEFLNKLAEKDKHLMQYGWVSLFTFDPRIGKEIMEEWISAEANITWLKNAKAKAVIYAQGTKFPKVAGVSFSDGTVVKAKVTIDATELGDLLALGKIPYRLGWEYAGEFHEPSAPLKKSGLIERYPLQELTWPFYLKDYGAGNKAPVIPTPVGYTYQKAAQRYWCALKNPSLDRKSSFAYELLNPAWAIKYEQAEKHSQFHSPESFLTYGQVSPDLFMINWPKCANDFSLGIERAFSEDVKVRERFYKEARTYSLWFAKYVQDTLGPRYGLAEEVYPPAKANDCIGGIAYLPYNREVRRLQGFKTLTENDILPNLASGEQARYLPDSIAIGNYANDHHYYEMAKPGSLKYFKLAPKSIQWGGRYTGTPFSIPYGVMLPETVDGLLVAEKSWSVSHIANGSSRLQPVCMLMGQAAGAAAALSAQKNISPFDLPVKELQATLLNDPKAPPTLIPLFDVKSDEPYRAAIQRLIIAGIIPFPKDGNFQPAQKITEEDLLKWSSKAGVQLPNNKEYTRAEAAQLIEAEANTLKTIPVSAPSGQPIADFPVQEYCGTLKQGGNAKSFKLEWIKTKDGKPVIRQTPFNTNQANTAGAITADPEVYEYMLKNASLNPKICFLAAYNNSGAWMLITKIK